MYSPACDPYPYSYHQYHYSYFQHDQIKIRLIKTSPLNQPNYNHQLPPRCVCPLSLLLILITAHSYGIRARTRHSFARNFREKGFIKLSTYLKIYKVGDIVDVKVNGAVQKGMPHKFYHGRTGRVYNVTKTSVGVIFYKVVGNRYLEKRVNIRVEHVNHSKCRDDFLRRVKENARLRAEAKEKGETLVLKRQPAPPREARVIKTESNPVETLHAIAYETTI